MPQTQATSPFLPPIDESQIQMRWEKVTAMESGLPMQFPDGEKYELIYPELSIPQSAFNTSPKPENIEIRLESTIGIIGTGLLDAIEEDDIRQQYASTAAYYKEKGMDVAEYVNPSYWDAAANDFASGAWYTTFGSAGRMADGGQKVYLRPDARHASGRPRCQRGVEHHKREPPRPPETLYNRRMGEGHVGKS